MYPPFRLPKAQPPVAYLHCPDGIAPLLVRAPIAHLSSSLSDVDRGPVIHSLLFVAEENIYARSTKLLSLLHLRPFQPREGDRAARPVHTIDDPDPLWISVRDVYANCVWTPTHGTLSLRGLIAKLQLGKRLVMFRRFRSSNNPKGLAEDERPGT